MNIVLGFGSTEQDFEAEEERAIRDYIERRYNEAGLNYFTDTFVESVRAWLKERAAALRAKEAEYKDAAEYPTRYSYYWPVVVADASYIVVILRIHHINRRHAMSPDGWALMLTKPMFLIESIEIKDASAAA